MAKRSPRRAAAAESADESVKDGVITQPMHLKRSDPRAKGIEGTPKFPKQPK